jgi:hypothetical protein
MWKRLPLLCAVSLLAACCASGCHNNVGHADQDASAPPPVSNTPATGPIRLKDVTKAAHIDFTHNHGGSGRHYGIEQFAGGAAFIDYDADGWPDIFLVQSAPLPNYKGPLPLRSALYHNNHDGTFTNKIAGSGLDITMYGMGVTVGDYDNDGKPDLYITAFGGNRLFHNEGNGQFRDVTKQAGVSGKDMSTSAGWVDYDHDGLLDLFVCRYNDFALATDPACKENGKSAYCAPTDFKPTNPLLYHNNGDGTFTDVTNSSGIGKYTGRGLGVVAADFNEDGWVDIYETTDQTGNLLFINNGDGTFSERAAASGARETAHYGGMGVDCGDYQNQGHLSIVVTNYEREPISLYDNQGKGVFTVDTDMMPLMRGGRSFVKWGIRFVDLDMDGYQDLFLVNGHTNDTLPRYPIEDRRSYAQPAFLLRNVKGKFQVMGPEAGSFLQRPLVARAAAFGDYDNDGRPDILVACNNGPATLLHNDSPPTHNWIRLQLEGSGRPGYKGCNRDALAALVKVRANGMVQTQCVRSGSYMADHDRRLLFGIGQDKKAEVEIKWPCGAIQKVVVNAGQSPHINESACNLSKPGFHMPAPGLKARSRSYTG